MGFPGVSLVGAALVAGCAGGRPARVSPEEIPALEERLARAPDDGDLLLRYSAALLSAGRCDSARVVATRGMARRPESAIGPLVAGQCLERAGDYDQALAVYRRFLAAYRDRPGAPAVRARENFALRGRATTRARDALQREAELAQQPADPRTIAVLPIEIAGDSSYLPLGRGLAQIITSDLNLLRQFRMVERLQVGALLGEMRLGEGGQVDASTAARVGRLLQAGRMVQGLAAIPPEGDMRLEATVVQPTGDVTGPAVRSGRFQDLLRLEKDLVIGIASQLGYQLSEAERQLILENGTENLAAFLAYSRGVVAEDAGDYSTAALYFADAVRADPGFSDAQASFEANAVAEDVRAAEGGDVTTVASESVEAPEEAAPEPTGESLVTATEELAPQQMEGATATGGGTAGTTATNTQASNPNGTNTAIVTSSSVTGTIRIIFRLP